MVRKILLMIIVSVSVIVLSSCNSQKKNRRPDENTLYVGSVQTSFPTSFMPWLSREGIAPTIAGMLYSTLFSYDEETGNFDPVIGKEWYYVDDEGNPIVTEDGSIDYARLEEIYFKT